MNSADDALPSSTSFLKTLGALVDALGVLGLAAVGSGTLVAALVALALAVVCGESVEMAAFPQLKMKSFGVTIFLMVIADGSADAGTRKRRETSCQTHSQTAIRETQ